MTLIEDRTALVLRLEATLKEYYPEALSWFHNWVCPTAWDFVIQLPDAAALRRASVRQLHGFFKTHGLRAIAKQLRTLEAALANYRRRIEELFSTHPDAALFASLPRAGPKLAPRLLVFFGADRSRFTDARALQELSGVVPIVDRTGKQQRRTVCFR